MLMSSIWMGLAVLTTILMAADWYIWGPRYRASSAELAPCRVHEDSYRSDLRSAA